MQKALKHTVIINFSHYVQQKLLFRWFKSGVFQPHLGAYSRWERRYPYTKGCNSGPPQKILWKQVVTCSAHSKKHFKINLVEYWGRECTVGQVTSRTMCCFCRSSWCIILEVKVSFFFKWGNMSAISLEHLCGWLGSKHQFSFPFPWTYAKMKNSGIFMTYLL